MRIGRLGYSHIGWKVRKPSWGSCWLTITDIGQRYIIGQLFDYRENKVIGIKLYDLEDSDWEFYVCAEDVIKNLPVRENNEK